MIIGSYHLQVYCRNIEKGCLSTEADGTVYCGDFVGDDSKIAFGQARSNGWVFLGGEVTCPKCALEKKGEPDA